MNCFKLYQKNLMILIIFKMNRTLLMMILMILEKIYTKLIRVANNRICQKANSLIYIINYLYL